MPTVDSTGLEGLRYTILDPTGNITALVEDDVPVAEQPRVAARIMARHPDVEQVGFVRLGSPLLDGSALHAELRMAGGEFCGNASLCAAAFYAMRSLSENERSATLGLEVSGAERPVEVRLAREGAREFSASIQMPNARGIVEKELSYEGVVGKLPLVIMEGISHLVIEPGSTFAWLAGERAAAEDAVREWCKCLGVPGLGLMFLEGEAPMLRMAPLVYVAEGNTTYWENSCASGTAAVAMYLAHKAGGAVDITVEEPGGTLRVTSDPARDATWLYGHVRAC